MKLSENNFIKTNQSAVAMCFVYDSLTQSYSLFDDKFKNFTNFQGVCKSNVLGVTAVAFLSPTYLVIIDSLFFKLANNYGFICVLSVNGILLLVGIIMKVYDYYLQKLVAQAEEEEKENNEEEGEEDLEQEQFKDND